MPVGVGAKPATPPGGAKPAAAPGGKPAAPPAAPPAGAEGGKKGGKLKLIIIIVAAVVVLAAVAVGVLFALKALGIIGGGGEADAKPTEEPAVMGTQMVTSGESGVTVNLADGAHMVVHFNVYFTAKLDEDSSSSEHGSSKEIDTGPAVRAVQMALEGMSIDTLEKQGARQEMEKKIAKMLNEEPVPPYQGHVYSVYITDWVWQ